MFKISLLHATSGKQKGGLPADKQRSLKQTAQHQVDQQSTALAYALEPRDWSIQAATVTDGLLDASKYKSLAVYAEVKLAEALDKAAKALPDSVDEDGELLPNSLKTAVCCQLLGELAELCGPFSGTLLKLRDELLPALYSSYAGTQTGRPLQFDQMPWFLVANQLQCQNHALLDQQETIKLELNTHQAQMLAVEQQLLAFKAAMDAGEAAAAELQLANANLVAARDAAAEEAAAAVDESKRLAAAVMRLKDELGEMQEALNNAKEVASQDMEQWQGQLEAFKKQLHVEKQEREAAVAMAAARLTVQEGQELEQRCQEAERRLEEAKQKLAAFETGGSSSTAQVQLLTPRPTDWGAEQQLADTCKAASETVRQLLQQHAATVAALQRQLQLQQALAQPDPSPKALELSLRTDASSYFITEGGLDANGGTWLHGSNGDSRTSKPKLFAEALGTSQDIPRFLRWDEAVELQDVKLHQLQQQISSIWQCKAEYEALHGPCHLQTFLHQHFVAAATAAPVAAVAEDVPNTVDPVVAAADRNPDSISSSGRSTSAAAAAKDMAAQLTVAARAAATAGYQLYHGLATHRHCSVAANTMWHVLTGQLPEAVLHEQLQHVHGLLQLLQGLAARAAASSGDGASRNLVQSGSTNNAGNFGEQHQRIGLAVSDLSTVLRLLYPVKPPQQLVEVTTMLEAACRSVSSNTSSSVVNSHTSLTVHDVAAVAAAVGQQANRVVGCRGCFQDTHEHQQLPVHSSSQNTNISSTPTTEAVQELLECLVRQQLQDSLAHTQQVVQQVQQLLNGTSSASGATSGSSEAIERGAGASKQSRQVPPAGSPVWQQVSALLKQHTECSSSDSINSGSSSRPLIASRHVSISERQGTADRSRRLGSSRSGRYSTAVGGSEVHALSLVAAAAASRTNSATADDGMVTEYSTGSKQQHCSSCRTGVSEWLSTAQQFLADKMQVQQVVQWLQRKCLLVPSSCRQNVLAALQWSQSMHKGSASAVAAGAEGCASELHALQECA